MLTDRHAAMILGQKKFADQLLARCGQHLGKDDATCLMRYCYDEIFFSTALCVAAAEDADGEFAALAGKGSNYAAGSAEKQKRARYAGGRCCGVQVCHCGTQKRLDTGRQRNRRQG